MLESNDLQLYSYSLWAYAAQILVSTSLEPIGPISERDRLTLSAYADEISELTQRDADLMTVQNAHDEILGQLTIRGAIQLRMMSQMMAMKACEDDGDLLACAYVKHMEDESGPENGDSELRLVSTSEPSDPGESAPLPQCSVGFGIVSLPIDLIEHVLTPWLNRLEVHRRDALTDRQRADYLLAKWEARKIREIRPKLVQALTHSIGPDRDADVAEVELTSLEIGFLIHAVSFGIRQSRKKRDGESRSSVRALESAHASLWELMEPDSECFYVVPIQFGEQLLLPEFETYARLRNIGVPPPDVESETDEWMRSYASRLKTALADQRKYVDDEAPNYWVTVPATLLDVAMISSAMLGLIAATEDTNQRSMATKTLEFIVEFADPDTSSRTRSAMEQMTRHTPDRIIGPGKVLAEPNEPIRNGWATAGLSCGVLSIFFYSFLSIVVLLAIGFSITALVKLESYNGKGKIQAWAGLILGVIYLLMALFYDPTA